MLIETDYELLKTHFLLFQAYYLANIYCFVLCLSIFV